MTKRITSNQFTIVFPSYNEVENIPILIKRIENVLPSASIVIVDDSKLEQNNKLKKNIKQFKQVHLISRFKKSGRGSAVIDGLRHALKDKTKQYFFEMDSDLAQHPNEFKRFIKKINEENLDLVIGSRYIKGGRVIGVSKDRIWLSKIINRFLPFLLGVNITDYTDGFRLYTRKVVEIITKDKMKSTGFITLTEIVYKLNKKGIKMAEVPVTIYSRQYGSSTRGFSELSQSLIFVLKMKLEEFK